MLNKLAYIVQNLYSKGKFDEAKELFFISLRLAHKDNPLMSVLGDLGFEPSEVFEYGDDNHLDSVHPSEKSVHRRKGDEVQEIWMQWNSDTNKVEYGYVHEGGDYGHKHAYYDNLGDLVSHIVEEDEEEGDHPCQSGGECTCGGLCKAAAKKVKLNKPFRTPKGPKKFSVYVKNKKGNTIKVNFGDPNMEIKRDSPKRRKSFRARHHCENATDPTKARTWSCRMWQKNKSVSQMTKNKKKK